MSPTASPERAEPGEARPADLVLEGAMVLTMGTDPRVIDPGRVVIADGRIRRVGPCNDPVPEASEVRNLPGRVVMPGFINTHAHLASALTRGLGGDRFLTDETPPGRWLARAIREVTDDQVAYAGARLAITELLASGVTTTTDSQTAQHGLESAADGTLRALTESGMRAHFYRASVDRTDLIPSHRHDNLSLARSELDRLREGWESDRVKVGAEALSLHRVNPKLLRGLHEWASSADARFAMHISYSRHAADYPIREHGQRLMNLLASWGVLDSRFLGHHPVWLDPEEIETVVSSGAGLSVCSGANMLIGIGTVPLPELVTSDARLGLGTDQPNDAHNFFEVMKTTLLQQRAAEGQEPIFGTPELMLQLATWGGARALGLEDEVGSLAAGKRADILVLNGNQPALNPRPSRISNIVLAAGTAEVETVLVNGETVFEAGQPSAWEVTEVVAGAAAVVAQVAASVGRADSVISEWTVSEQLPRGGSDAV